MSTAQNASHEDENQQSLILDKEWERQQIKTFTAWMNSHLRKLKVHVESLDTDLRDGKKLITLLEIISNEMVAKPEKGNLRVHHVNNVNRALAFIARKGVKLAGIGAEEIVDGNVKMTLGMIWTIILRFAINILSDGHMSAKDGLLLWVKKKTEGYKGVNVTNFTTSFKDGLALCALIHRHRPELLDYDQLRKDNPVENLKLAFNIAEKHLDIPPMLEVESMMLPIPDEKSVMTYVSCFYHAFSSSQQMENASRRILKVLDTNLENQKKMEQYETLATDLLDWINNKIPELQKRCDGVPVMQELVDRRTGMQTYKKSEKPPRADQKAQLESLFNTLKTKLHLLNRPEYIPPDGMQVKDINSKWGDLEREEKALLDWLTLMMQQLEFLEHLVKKFYLKCSQQDMWMSGKAEQMSVNVDCSSLAPLVALQKKHVSFMNEKRSRDSRIKIITSLQQRLHELGYSKIDEVDARYASVMSAWEELQKISDKFTVDLEEKLKIAYVIDDLYTSFAQKAPGFKCFVADSVDDLNDTYHAQSVDDVKRLISEHGEFASNLSHAKEEMEELKTIENKISELTQTPNPYTSVRASDLESKWSELETLVVQRTETLKKELETQQANEEMRKSFASLADEIEAFRDRTHVEIQSSSVGSKDAFEDCIANLKRIGVSIDEFYRVKLPAIEELNKAMQAAGIYINQYTQHTLETIGTSYQHLMHTLSSTINEVENQILVRDSGNISEQQLRDYRKSFDYFDKNKVNYLNYDEFRSLLVSLAFNVSTDDKSGDQEFERILAKVDAEKTAQVTFSNFLNFVATENKDTDTAEQVIDSFRILAGGNEYITPDVIRREFPASHAESLIKSMSPSTVAGAPSGALDYRTFAGTLYGESDL